MQGLLQSTYEPFKTVNIDGFDDHGYAIAKSSNDVTGQTNALREMSNDNMNNTQQQQNNYAVLNSKVASLGKLRDENGDTIKDHQLHKIKKNNPVMKPSGSDILQRARTEDSDIFILQQNYIYILGTITFAIVAVGAFVIAKN
jgi:hypothetical protein